MLHCGFSLRAPQGGLAQSVDSLGASLSGPWLVFPDFIHCFIHSIIPHVVNAQHMPEPLPRVRVDVLRKDVCADSSAGGCLARDIVKSFQGKCSLALNCR